MAFADEIYKIHGSASEPASMVLDEADYAAFRKRQAYLAAKILTLFVEYPILFLGYSLQDPDIASIMESIARCAGDGTPANLVDRFVFVEFGDSNGAPIRTIERMFGTESISMTHVVTRDFLPIYEAIAASQTRYDPRVVRMLRRSVYAIATHLDPTSTVVTSGFSRLDDLADDERVVIGFNAISEGFGRMPTAEDLYYDCIFGEEDLNPMLVVGDYLPKLLRTNPGGLPMYKYLRDIDTVMLDERVASLIEKRTTMDDYLNDGIRRSAPGWRDLLNSFSLKGLIDAFGFDAAHTRLAALHPEEIDARELGSHLGQVVSRGGGKGVIRNNSELKRAIRIYDFLRYGGPTKEDPSPAS